MTEDSHVVLRRVKCVVTVLSSLSVCVRFLLWTPSVCGASGRTGARASLHGAGGKDLHAQLQVKHTTPADHCSTPTKHTLHISVFTECCWRSPAAGRPGSSWRKWDLPLTLSWGEVTWPQTTCTEPLTESPKEWRCDTHTFSSAHRLTLFNYNFFNY